MGALASVAMCVIMGATSFSAATASSSTVAAINPHTLHFATVVKDTGVAWFNEMYSGEEVFAKKTGVHVTQTGPATATAEGQLAIIESLIPTKPAVIGIDPNNQQALEGVLGTALKDHIIVVGQEAPQLVNVSFDLEAFNNVTYGQDIMNTLAKCMGDKGQYAAFVGSLTTAAHMLWVASAYAQAKKHYPGITRVGGGPISSQEEVSVSFAETKELLVKYPHLKGIEGSSSNDVIGAAEAVTEMGLAGKVCIVGVTLPSMARQYIKNGTIYSIYLWDPGLTGEATMYAALMLVEGKKVGKGTNLGVPGYTDIQPCGPGTSPHCYMGTGQLVVNKSNVNEYHF
jgi:simple sugar transport system substrate-binding protein